MKTKDIEAIQKYIILYSEQNTGKSIKDRNEINRLCTLLNREKFNFHCLTLTRDDFINDGVNPVTLSDRDMQDIANSIGDECDDEFWHGIIQAENEYNLIKK